MWHRLNAPREGKRRRKKESCPIQIPMGWIYIGWREEGRGEEEEKKYLSFMGLMLFGKRGGGGGEGSAIDLCLEGRAHKNSRSGIEGDGMSTADDTYIYTVGPMHWHKKK